MAAPTKAELEQALADRDELLDEASEILDDEGLNESEKLTQLESLLFDEE